MQGGKLLPKREKGKGKREKGKGKRETYFLFPERDQAYFRHEWWSEFLDQVERR